MNRIDTCNNITMYNGYKNMKIYMSTILYYLNMNCRESACRAGNRLGCEQQLGGAPFVTILRM